MCLWNLNWTLDFGISDELSLFINLFSNTRLLCKVYFYSVIWLKHLIWFKKKNYYLCFLFSFLFLKFSMFLWSRSVDSYWFLLLILVKKTSRKYIVVTLLDKTCFYIHCFFLVLSLKKSGSNIFSLCWYFLL